MRITGSIRRSKLDTGDDIVRRMLWSGPHRGPTRPGLLVRGFFAVLLLSLVPSQVAVAQAECSGSSTGLTPIDDLGGDVYLGHVGGLYPGGSNDLPADHLEGGLRAMASVRPRDEDGVSDSAGSIGLIAIGVSNTKIEFDRFIEVVESSPDVNTNLVLVNGAQGARALDDWATDAAANPWENLRKDVAGEGLSALQVQVAWIKLPDKSRGTVDLSDTDLELEQMTKVLQIAKAEYPNLVLAFLSSRIYGGYGGASDSEPKAYQHGFAVKWLIERQIEGDPTLNADPDLGTVNAPWIGWGPYLWADGVSARSDGLVWTCADMSDDGIHPGPSAADKVATLLFAHFSDHETTRTWFIGDGPMATTTSTVPERPNRTPSTRAGLREERQDDRQEREARPAAAPDSASGPANPAPGSTILGTWLLAGLAAGFGVSTMLVVAAGIKWDRSTEHGSSSDDLEIL